MYSRIIYIFFFGDMCTSKHTRAGFVLMVYSVYNQKQRIENSSLRHAHARTPTRAHTHARMHIHHTHTHVCRRMHTRTHTLVHTRANTHAHHTHTRLHTPRTREHTYTYTQSWLLSDSAHNSSFAVLHSVLHSVIQCDAVCCSVLQCVAVCCSVL